jgi:photosystem II stability/assembly factor-like uncharacterized protein
MVIFVVIILHCLIANAQWITQGADILDQIHQVIALSDSVAWARPSSYGYNNYCARTTDGGETWEIKTIDSAPSSVSWMGLSAIDSLNAWALLCKDFQTDLEGIYKTTDGGDSWIKLNTTGLYESVYSYPVIIYFWNTNNGLVIGNPVSGYFEIYLTSDGGNTWAPVNHDYLPAAAPYESAAPLGFTLGNGVLWFSTDAVRAFKTTDMGFSWDVYETGLTPVYFSYPITCRDENTCWISNESELKGTTDGGITWNDIPITGPFFRDAIGYVPGTSSVLISVAGGEGGNYDGSSYSLDGGHSWTGIDVDVNHYCVSFLNNYTGWSGGESGIYKYDGSFQATENTGISEQSSKLEVYPNPGSGSFYFSYYSENNAPILLQIRDLKGQSVFVKYFKTNSETRLISLDLKDKPKGIYFLQIINGNELMTEKLIIN